MSVGKEKVLLLVLTIVIVLITGGELYAFDENQLRFASLVTKYKNGYLVSLASKEISLDSKGLEKYIVNPPMQQEGWIYRPIDKNDHSLIESKFQFSLKDKLIFFGSWHRDNLIIQGESYYLKYNELGAGIRIEDIMVFVKGTEELDKILPIWAKKYSTDDETFKWIELGARKIQNFGGVNTSLLENIHKYIRNVINRKAKEERINYSIFEVSNEYKDETFSIELNSQSDNDYLVIVNGLSYTNNLKYSMALIMNEHLKKRVDVIPTTIFQDDREYLDNSFILEHIYHSKKLGQDLIIGKHKAGLGYRVYLIFQGNQKIIKMPIFIQYGD